MGLGWTDPLYILAFDQRGSLLKGLFGIESEPSPAQADAAIAAKRLIFDGLLEATRRGAAPSTLGVLVDEQFGAAVAAEAAGHGLKLALAVERSSQPIFELEYGEAFAEHIERFDPDFVKVLVRHNPEGDDSANTTQLERLKKLSDWVGAHDRKLLFELLLPAEPAQLASVGGDAGRYDTELRPGLMARAMSEIQDAGIETDLWKIEGLDSRADADRLARQARTGPGREDVGCIVLGRGASVERVDHWLVQAAPVRGFLGFAIGRTIWWEAVRRHLSGELERDAAVDHISSAYMRFIEVYEQARSAVNPPAP